RIHVAYLSADFHDHATAYLMAGLFESHDRSRFETTAVSFGPEQGGEMRHRLQQSFEHFVEVRAETDEGIARLLRDLEVDIAVDLKGLTLDSRAGVFARRPAPVQATYMGFPATLGANFIDYFLADAYTIPPGQRDAFAEKIVYLPDTYFATSYRANEAHRQRAQIAPARAQAGPPEPGVVLGGFHHPYQITPDAFERSSSLPHKNRVR